MGKIKAKLGMNFAKCEAEKLIKGTSKNIKGLQISRMPKIYQFKMSMIITIKLPQKKLRKVWEDRQINLTSTQ